MGECCSFIDCAKLFEARIVGAQHRESYATIVSTVSIMAAMNDGKCCYD